MCVCMSGCFDVSIYVCVGVLMSGCMSVSISICLDVLRCLSGFLSVSVWIFVSMSGYPMSWCVVVCLSVLMSLHITMWDFSLDVWMCIC